MQWIWHLFWIIPVFGGTISAIVSRLEVMNERRAERAQERYRLKQEVRLAKVHAQTATATRTEAQIIQVRKLMQQQQSTVDAWASYELDPVRLLEYPVMADVREPLVAALHRAMLAADALRPSTPDELTDRDDIAQYGDAVHTMETAFRAAEAEALRRGWSDFDDAERARLARAQKMFGLANDAGATAQERSQAMIRGRSEVDGLIVLPRRTVAALQRKVAGALEA